MTNQQKMTIAMSDLLDLLIDLTAQVRDSSDSAEINELMPLISDITTNTKRLGDSVALENIEEQPIIEPKENKVIEEKKVNKKNVNKRTNK